MDVETLLGKATDSLTVGRVFGPPIERDGTLIIPVAWVAGGGGGGTAEGNESQPNGSGAGVRRQGRQRPVGTGDRRDTGRPLRDPLPPGRRATQGHPGAAGPPPIDVDRRAPAVGAAATSGPAGAGP